MFAVQLTTSRIGNLTRLILLLLYIMTIHTVPVLRCGTVNLTEFWGADLPQATIGPFQGNAGPVEVSQKNRGRIKSLLFPHIVRSLEPVVTDRRRLPFPYHR